MSLSKLKNEKIERALSLATLLLAPAYLFLFFISENVRAEDISAAAANFTFTGWKNYANYGSAIDVGGDVNADGFQDLVIAAKNGSTNCFGEASCDGLVQVINGENAQIIFSATGESNLSNSPNGFGSSVSFGDFNGDGYDDLAVGAESQDQFGANSGKVYLFYGPNGDVGSSLICDAKENANCGKSLSAICDFDRDGSDDILVGANNKFFLYSGKTQQIIFTFYSQQGANDDWARKLNCAGDLNGDGNPDILVSAPTAKDSLADQGVVYVYSGGDGAQIWEGFGKSESDFYGTSITRTGDINGDGAGDFAIGAIQQNGPGYVDIISGRDGVLIAEIQNPEDCGEECEFGSSVTAAGDLNDDDIPDILISDPTFDSGRGRLYAFSGADFSIIFTISGEGVSGDGFSVPCTGIAGGFDANQDGQSDFLCAAPYHDSGGTDAGRVYLFLGGDLQNIPLPPPIVDPPLPELSCTEQDQQIEELQEANANLNLQLSYYKTLSEELLIQNSELQIQINTLQSKIDELETRAKQAHQDHKSPHHENYSKHYGKEEPQKKSKKNEIHQNLWENLSTWAKGLLEWY